MNIIRKMIILIFIPAAILIISCTGQSDTEKSRSSSYSGDAPVKWETLVSGLDRAKKEKKPVLIFFYTDWCTYCSKMDSQVFSNNEVSGYMNENFINIKVNPEKNTSAVQIMGEKITPMQLMSFMGGRGFPTTVFWDKNSKPLTAFPGFVEKDVFLSLIKYMSLECYNSKIKLDDYIKGKARCDKKKDA